MREDRVVLFWIAFAIMWMFAVIVYDLPLYAIPLGGVMMRLGYLAPSIGRTVQRKWKLKKKAKALQLAIEQVKRDFRKPVAAELPGAKDEMPPPHRCPKAIAKAVANGARISFSPSKYLQSPINMSVYEFRSYHCWKCQREMVVFNWRRHQMYQQLPPPKPVPPSVQYRWSNTMDMRYWVNVCLDCDAIQGDYIVFVQNYDHLEWDYVIQSPFECSAP
jgi:hypothetical protein